MSPLSSCRVRSFALVSFFSLLKREKENKKQQRTEEVRFLRIKMKMHKHKNLTENLSILLLFFFPCGEKKNLQTRSHAGGRRGRQRLVGMSCRATHRRVPECFASCRLQRVEAAK